MKKTPDITRNIRLQSKRQEGDAPDLGPVFRVSDAGFPVASQRVRRRPKGVSATRKWSILVWFILLGLTIFALVAFTMYQ